MDHHLTALSPNPGNPKVFVSGTGTGLGKTIVSSWLCLHWQAEYWKPIQSGLAETTDSEWVAQLAQVTVHPETYRLTQPLSPHESARRDGVQIELAQFKTPKTERLIIEGAGGLLVPLNQSQLMTDLIAHLQTPTLLVASSELGTINHTLLSLQALAQRQLPCLGVVLVGPDNPSNAQAIEHFGQTQVLARLPHLSALTRDALSQHPIPGRLSETLAAL